MEPGREMDAAVAIAACGWKWMAYDYGFPIGPRIAIYSPNEMATRAVWEPDAVYEREPEWDEGLPNYSTSDADAFAALDAVLAKHLDYGVEMRFTRKPHVLTPAGWHVNFVGHDGEALHEYTLGFSIAPTRAEAICRAILALTEKG